MPLALHPWWTDALPVLTVYVVALYAIPSDLIVEPLGAAGTPAQIIAIGLLGWWLASQLVAFTTTRTSNPVHWLLLLFVAAMIASYVTGMSHPIGSSLEVNSSDRALLSLGAWCGVILVMSDGITTRARLEKLMHWVAALAVGIAVLGVLQFFFALDLAHLIKIPGLSTNGAIGTLFHRSGYRRVAGTTSHPIEFGVVLAATLPLVIHCARVATSRAKARGWWAGVGIVAISLPMSVARSAVLGGAIAILYLFHTWPADLKKKLSLAGVVGILFTTVSAPGLLGTIRSLFLNSESDPSTQGRTADYGPVWEYFQQSPVFGRGIGTFIPDIYRTLDNQFLGSSVEAGAVGLVAVLSLLVGSIIVAGRIRRNSTDEATRDLAQCLKAGIAVIGVNAATFDAFGFPACVGTLFVLIGATATLWSLTADRSPRPREARTVLFPGSAAPRVLPDWRLRSIFVAAALSLCLGGAAYEQLTARDSHQAIASVILVPPVSVAQNAFDRVGNASSATSVLHDVMVSDPVREDLATRTPDRYEIAVGNGSLQRDSDVVGYGPTLRISVTGSSPDEASAALAAVMTETARQLSDLQNRVGVPSSETIGLKTIQVGTPFTVTGRPTRALLGLAALFGLMSVLAFRTLHRRGLQARLPRHAVRRPATREPVS